MNMGQRIKKIRKEKDLTQHELALKANISRSYLADVENNRYNPSLDTLKKIADALDVSTDRLTGEALSSIIADKLEENEMTLEEVAEKTGVSLHWLENLDSFIPWGKEDEYGYIWITRVAKVLELPGSKLRAALARQEPSTYDGPQSSPEEDFFTINEPNVQYLAKQKNLHRIPVLGSIPAGYAVEDIIAWEEIPVEWLSGNREYFGLKVKGDSMYPEYLEGDTVIVRKQAACDSGDDCAVMVNANDATLKRVKKYADGIELEAINPMYGKKKYSNEEINNIPVTILGVVVELRRKKK